MFGIYSKITGGRCQKNLIERAKISRECTEIVRKIKAKRVIRDASRQRNASSIKEIQKVSTLPPGHAVLVYREKTGWQPYELVRIRDTDVDVVLQSKMILTFFIDVVRRFYEINASETMENVVTRPIIETKEPETATADRERPVITRSHTRKKKGGSFGLKVESMNKNFFRFSRKNKTSSVLEMTCVQITPKTEAKGQCLYRSGFVDKIESDSTKRSRLCVAGCNDENHCFSSAALTIKRISFRSLLFIAAIM